MQEFEFFVMDGRARFDTGRAAVFSSLGRNPPKQWKLSRDWGGMDAVLVRAPVQSESSNGKTSCGDFEYLCDIE
jgi:hypothetical protein